MDPSMEHIQAMAGKTFQAFPKQDHKAHIDAHLNFMGTTAWLEIILQFLLWCKKIY